MAEEGWEISRERSAIMGNRKCLVLHEAFADRQATPGYWPAASQTADYGLVLMWVGTATAAAESSPHYLYSSPYSITTTTLLYCAHCTQTAAPTSSVTQFA